jgi:hypothetical protein
VGDKHARPEPAADRKALTQRLELHVGELDLQRRKILLQVLDR